MPANTEVVLTEYPQRYLDCRIVNHPWQEDVNGPWVQNQDGVQVIYEKFTCRRCGNVRIDQRNRHGLLLRRNYRHQVNFLLPMELRKHDMLAQERTRRILASLQVPSTVASTA